MLLIIGLMTTQEALPGRIQIQLNAEQLGAIRQAVDRTLENARSTLIGRHEIGGRQWCEGGTPQNVFLRPFDDNRDFQTGRFSYILWAIGTCSTCHHHVTMLTDEPEPKCDSYPPEWDSYYKVRDLPLIQ